MVSRVAMFVPSSTLVISRKYPPCAEPTTTSPKSKARSAGSQEKWKVNTRSPSSESTDS